MNTLYLYQNIPLHLDPTAFAVGSLSVGWYSLMYLIGFSTVYFLLVYRIEKKEFTIYNLQFTILELKNIILDFLLFALSGALVGGRVGYVLFYNLPYYLHNPLSIISPYDFTTGKLIGIYGMSYHGGVIGILIMATIFTKKYKINFWQLADFIVPAIPAGYFFGRIGNFFNLELYGRATTSWIGMHFPLWTGAGPLLRYPSQLFEAFFEGVILFVILWSIRGQKKFPGYFLAWYVIGYGIIRFLLEFFREPDEQIGFIFHYITLGQILSLAMIIVGIGVYFHRNRLNSIIK